MGLNGSDDLVELTCDGKTVYVMVLMVCWNYHCEGRTVYVMVVRVWWN